MSAAANLQPLRCSIRSTPGSGLPIGNSVLHRIAGAQNGNRSLRDMRKIVEQWQRCRIAWVYLDVGALGPASRTLATVQRRGFGVPLRYTVEDSMYYIRRAYSNPTQQDTLQRIKQVLFRP